MPMKTSMTSASTAGCHLAKILYAGLQRRTTRNTVGCMYGVHGVVVGIVFNVGITSMPQLIVALVHEMVHADVEICPLSTGMQSHGRHFKEGVRRAVEALQGQLNMLTNSAG